MDSRCHVSRVHVLGSNCCTATSNTGAAEGGSGRAAAPDTPVTTPPQSKAGRFIRTLGSDFRHLPTPWNAAILGIGGTLSIVAHNSDPGLNRRFERGKWIDALYETGSMVGDGYVQIGGAVLTYAIWRRE